MIDKQDISIVEVMFHVVLLIKDQVILRQKIIYIAEELVVVECHIHYQVDVVPIGSIIILVHIIVIQMLDVEVFMDVIE